MTVLVLLFALVAPAMAKKPARTESAQGPVIEEREAAEGLVAQEIDLDGNGRIDVRNLWRPRDDGGRTLVRKETDLDLDGRMDVISHFDAAGALQREEMDVDFDGRPDWTDHYKDGQRVFAELDSNFDGRADTFFYYLAADGGGKPRLDRKERDTDADGKVDLWERFDADGNVTRTARDTDGDGRMDERDE
jgi:hypothetical protein